MTDRFLHSSIAVDCLAKAIGSRAGAQRAVRVERSSCASTPPRSRGQSRNHFDLQLEFG